MRTFGDLTSFIHDGDTLSQNQSLINSFYFVDSFGFAFNVPTVVVSVVLVVDVSFFMFCEKFHAQIFFLFVT